MSAGGPNFNAYIRPDGTTSRDGMLLGSGDASAYSVLSKIVATSSDETPKSEAIKRIPVVNGLKFLEPAQANHDASNDQAVTGVEEEVVREPRSVSGVIQGDLDEFVGKTLSDFSKVLVDRYHKVEDNNASVQRGNQNAQSAIDWLKDTQRKSLLFWNRKSPEYATDRLAKAINTDNVDKLKAWIAAGANANATDANGKSLLHLELDKDNPNIEILKILIEAGADIGKVEPWLNETPFFRAIMSNDQDIIKLFVDNLNGKDNARYVLNITNWNSETVLHVLGQRNDQLLAPNYLKNIVNTLLENGANPNIRNKKDDPPLYKALKSGNHAVSEELLRNKKTKIDIRNELEETAIHCAARHADSNNIRTLFDIAQDLYDDIVKDYINSETRSGQTPLHIASAYGNKDAVLELLQNGANPFATNKRKETTLMTAAMNGHYDIVKILLAAGVNPKAANIAGLTALDYAAESGRASIVNELINAGYSVNPAKPLRRALNQKHIDINTVSVLLNAHLNAGVQIDTKNEKLVQQLEEVAVNALKQLNKLKESSENTPEIHRLRKERTQLIRTIVNTGCPQSITQKLLKIALKNDNRQIIDILTGTELKKRVSKEYRNFADDKNTYTEIGIETSRHSNERVQNSINQYAAGRARGHNRSEYAMKRRHLVQ